MLIEGHTDSTAPDAYNLALSQRRANAVEDFLITQGVDQTGIRAAGYVRQEPQGQAHAVAARSLPGWAQSSSLHVNQITGPANLKP